MEVIIKAKPKEIADLVVALQERQFPEVEQKTLIDFLGELESLLPSFHIPE